MTTLEVDI